MIFWLAIGILWSTKWGGAVTKSFVLSRLVKVRGTNWPKQAGDNWWQLVTGKPNKVGIKPFKAVTSRQFCFDNILLNSCIVLVLGHLLYQHEFRSSTFVCELPVNETNQFLQIKYLSASNSDFIKENETISHKMTIRVNDDSTDFVVSTNCGLNAHGRRTAWARTCNTNSNHAL